MTELLVILCLFCVLCLMVVAFTYSKLYDQIQRTTELLKRAEGAVILSEENTKKIADAHNSLSKRVIDMGSDVEVLRTKIEFGKRV